VLEQDNAKTIDSSEWSKYSFQVDAHSLPHRFHKVLAASAASRSISKCNIIGFPHYTIGLTNHQNAYL